MWLPLLRAIRCFAAAIDVDPTKDRAYVCRGDAYKAIKKYNLALIDYTRASELTLFPLP